MDAAPKRTIQIAGGHANLAVVAAIGHVCLQWSRLEMTVFGLLVTIELVELEKGAILFGGLDLLPRLNLAISLARANKVPIRLIKRIEEVRRAIQKGGLAERRNQVVHGAHKDMAEFETTLTMVRWSGEKRTKRFTAKSINEVAIEAYALGDEVWKAMDEIGKWRLKKISDEAVEHYE